MNVVECDVKRVVMALVNQERFVKISPDLFRAIVYQGNS